MADRLPKITESGTYSSDYGPAPPLEPGQTLAKPSPLGFWRAARTPVILFFVGLVVFGLATWERILKPSPDIHFVYQADAFLNGQLELTRPPPHGNDWASYSELTLNGGQVIRGVWFNRAEDKFLTLEGEILILDRLERRRMREQHHHFVSFPPGPAVLMLPFVKIWGYDFNDVWFTLFFAALNLSLLYLVLRRLSLGGRTGRSHRENLWLVVLLGFGTVYLWSANRGQVWYTALIVGITFTLLYLHFAMDARRPLLAGLFLACAFATRTPLLFSAIIFPLFVLFPGGKLRREGWGEAAKKLALFCAIPLVVGAALLYMNYLRFENPLEFGHRFLAHGQIPRIRDYGLFNYHFLARNLSAALTLLPRIQPTEPYVLVSKHGMSLFLTTPAWFYLFRPRPRQYRQDVLWFRMLWVTVLAIAIPHFFYQNTGWSQFGYRFSLDYTPYLILLLALGRFPQTRVFKLIVVVGILVNVFGAVTFQRWEMFYTDWFFDP